MNIAGKEIPFINRYYKVVGGTYIGFVGKCVSYNLNHDLPVILLDEKDYSSRAVRLNEIEAITDNGNISIEQKN